MLNVAVIGAGIFGLQLTLELHDLGYEISLFEAKQEIIAGATSKSLLRVHKGLHYPRHLPTAQQSLRNYNSFVSKFGDSVNRSFDNYYLLMDKQSKVNSKEMKRFLGELNSDAQFIDLKQLEAIGVNPKDVSLALISNEGVVDINVIRDIFTKELKQRQIFPHLNTNVREVVQKSSKWRLLNQNQDLGLFDFVVLATYGLRPKIEGINVVNLKYMEYHLTLALEVKMDRRPIGLTAIDGDFLTVLPKGHSDSFLVYGPNPSRLEVHRGTEVPESWLAPEREEARAGVLNKASTELIRRIEKFLPGSEPVICNEPLIGIRSVEINSQATDARESGVTVIFDNLFEINSGKIDHCLEVSRDIACLIAKTKKI